MKRFTLLALALAAGSVMAAQPKGDIAKGKEIATNICAACHAADGNSGIAMYPKLSAQFPNYIFHQTKAIKEGKRTTGAAASMAPMVMGLSDQDIADVAAFYAGHGKVKEGKAKEGNAEVTALLQKGACVSCHGENFAKPIDPSYPQIAGQYADYLYVALRQYKDGSGAYFGRSNAIMAGIAKQFTNAELKALAGYVGSLDTNLQFVPEARFR